MTPIIRLDDPLLDEFRKLFKYERYISWTVCEGDCDIYVEGEGINSCYEESKEIFIANIAPDIKIVSDNEFVMLNGSYWLCPLEIKAIVKKYKIKQEQLELFK